MIAHFRIGMYRKAPAYDAGFVDSVKAGRLEVVAVVEGFSAAR